MLSYQWQLKKLSVLLSDNESLRSNFQKKDLIKRGLTEINTKLKLENGAQIISYELTHPGIQFFKANDGGSRAFCRFVYFHY